MMAQAAHTWLRASAIGVIVIGVMLLLTMFWVGTCGCGARSWQDGEPRRPVRDAIRERRQQQQDRPAVGEAGERFVEFGGMRRRYVVHLPRGYDGEGKLPVVLSFHGGMANADIQREQSRMNRVADEHGFMVVYVDGTGRTRLLTFNAGTCCGYAMRRNVDDVGFVRRLITSELPSEFPIDEKRIYATGFSNGAMLSHRLGAELSDLIAAIAPVAGTLGVDGPRPSRPVPVMHFHGMEDQNSPFEGGVGERQFQPNPHRSVRSTIEWWVRSNNCEREPTKTQEGKEYVMERYEPASGEAGAPVVLYILPRGGHTWPGGEEVGAHLELGRLIKEVDASALMWEFFAQHRLE